jgi:nuclear pore complex protein Nup98-Nup96
VTIETREVVVYPDDLPDPKPAVGEELNKPAVICMDGFWPKDKTTGDLIHDEQRLESMNYSSRLQKIVSKTGGRFLEYKPETGRCVFQVKCLVYLWGRLGRV